MRPSQNAPDSLVRLVAGLMVRGHLNNRHLDRISGWDRLRDPLCGRMKRQPLLRHWFPLLLERCPLSQKSRVERLKAKVEPLSTYVRVDTAVERSGTNSDSHQQPGSELFTPF